MGRNASMTSYNGEPIIFSTQLLTQSVRQEEDSWRPIGYISDLEYKSSAQKSMDSSRTAGTGRTIRNYHKILSVLFCELKQCQKDGGFPCYVQMGDHIKYLHVIPVLAYIKDDAKSGNAWVGCYSGKNCLGRVCRFCLTGFNKLDDPLHACKWVHMSDHDTILQRLRAAEEAVAVANLPTRELKKEVKKYCKALDDMSMHVHDNATIDIDWGCNPYGATLGTLSDMMHLRESGNFPRVLKSFVKSMPTPVQARFDELLEDILVLLKSTSEFLCVNFRGGRTSLTMLPSHHWPGMAFAFLSVLLLTNEGRDLCRDCFTDEDTTEWKTDYDWDKVEPVRLSNKYHPPVLLLDEEDDEMVFQEEEEVDEEFVPMYVIEEGMTDGEEDEHGTLVSARHCTDDDDDIESAVHTSGKEGAANRGPVQMNCSHWQFIYLIQEMLAFHAYYKYGACPFGPHSVEDSDEELVKLTNDIHQMMARMQSFCPRQEGYGWRLQKYLKSIMRRYTCRSPCSTSVLQQTSMQALMNVT